MSGSTTGLSENINKHYFETTPTKTHTTHETTPTKIHTHAHIYTHTHIY